MRYSNNYIPWRSLAWLLLICALAGNSLASTLHITPKDPRFCGLPAAATNLTCDPITYSQSVISRSIFIVVISCVLFIAVTVLLCIPTFVKTGHCHCIGKDHDIHEKRYGGMKGHAIFICAFLIFAAGCACGITANVRSNVVFYGTTDYLNLKAGDVRGIADNITSVVTEIRKYYALPDGVESQISQGLTGVQDNLQTVSYYISLVGPYKDIYAFGATVWILLVGIVGILYVHFGKDPLYYIVLFMAWCVVCGVCIFMVVMFAISLSMGDGCNELSYDPSVLDLIQNLINQAFASLSDFINSNIDNLITASCQPINNNCSLVPDLCPCDVASFPTVTDRMVNDSVYTNATGYRSTARTVRECAAQCENADLREVARRITEGHDVYVEFLVVLMNTERFFMEGFTGNDTRAQLSVILCETGPITGPLWIGCTLLLLGAIVLGLSLLFLERAMFCFDENDFEDVKNQDL
eukprot:TRINITY_DN27772_c0_g1_i1.p1 TRINITY_DN27772_c0_g1~~TRINITY_DN27772_c0_g1_i1.p1  ORF type:complete len:467 (+),score=50.21 TRINITY_DN27772_c0_g1_i1:50-1450(+)